MFFFFVCGEKTFRKELKGYEGLTCQCHHCGNMSGRVLQRRPFFTFCWIPIIPFSISGYKDVTCHICNFNQPLESRPDVMEMANGGAASGAHHPPPPPSQQQQYQGGPPAGYNGQPKGPHQGQYQGQGNPQYR